MNHTIYQHSPELWLDYRRAAWLPRTQTLVVSDLHLGYAWAHRHQGQLLPLSVPDDTLPRLLDLVRSYAPQEIVLLGDVVHRAVPIPELRAALLSIVTQLSAQATVTFIAGNHDRHLKRLLAGVDLPCRIVRQVVCGSCLLVHGDGELIAPRSQECPEGWQQVLIGHEHPAVSLGDGVATWVRCPCFLLSESLVVLPAFSLWAAGTVWGSHPLMSAWAQQAHFTHALAIAGERLLKVPLR